MFPRLRLKIFFFRLQLKNFASGSTYESSAPTGSGSKKTNFDIKYLKNLNFNKLKLSKTQKRKNRKKDLHSLKKLSSVILNCR